MPSRDRCCYIAQSTNKQCRRGAADDDYRELDSLLPLCGAHQRWEGRADLNNCITEEWRSYEGSEDFDWIDNPDSPIDGVLESAPDKALIRRGGVLWLNISENKRHLAEQVEMFNTHLHEDKIWSDMKRHYITDLMKALYCWQLELSYISKIIEARKQQPIVFHRVSPAASAVQAPTIQ
jgi:hypothetical protein